MKRIVFLLVSMLISIISFGQVNALSNEIAEDLDLKAVATLFGEANSVEDFEKKLNDNVLAISNIDLNGDGIVDYLRCVEYTDQNSHYILIQAVLAGNIYQDIATIFVNKDTNGVITTQVIGNEYIYGVNYIVQPVYIYRPAIYNWFWGVTYRPWYSPYYWGFYPSYHHHYHRHHHDAYWHHIHDFHHQHHGSFSHPEKPHHDMKPQPIEHHNGYASQYPERSYVIRHPNGGNVRNNASQQRPSSNASRQPVNTVHTNQPSQPVRVTTSNNGRQPTNSNSRTTATSTQPSRASTPVRSSNNQPVRTQPTRSSSQSQTSRPTTSSSRPNSSSSSSSRSGSASRPSTSSSRPSSSSSSRQTGGRR